MNTANLQLEGLLVALTHLVGVLQRKGLMTHEEVRDALAQAEKTALGHADRGGQLREANQQAILFPIRYLAEATSSHAQGRPYREITADIGRDKDAGLST
jgi:hypothetical protein